uniref:Brix domain-containing protein n=1 Tax=Oryza punctata TaxID=4537 RepID=A0A0E0JE16_ORYPU
MDGSGGGGGGGGDPGGRVGEAKPGAHAQGTSERPHRQPGVGESRPRRGGGGGTRRRAPWPCRRRALVAVRAGCWNRVEGEEFVPSPDSSFIRYGTLLRNISFLLPYDVQGKAYTCPSDKINVFLKWSRCNLCLFFEWAEGDQKMICHMFNTLKEIHISFLINPDESIELKVTNPLLSFSSNFVGDDTWALVKDMLMMMFSPLQEHEPAASDLYVFTKNGDSVYFRIFKIPIKLWMVFKVSMTVGGMSRGSSTEPAETSLQSLGRSTATKRQTSRRQRLWTNCQVEPKTFAPKLRDSGPKGANQPMEVHLAAQEEAQG